MTLRRFAIFFAAGLLLASAVFALCVMVGPDPQSPGKTILAWPESAVFSYRMTRVISAAVVGAALAAAGVIFQALLKNPLADPYVLGVSSGSSMMTLLWAIIAAPLLTAITAGRAPEWLRYLVEGGEVFPAVIGALGTCILVFWVAYVTSGRTLEPLTLLLVGVIISSFNGALILLLNSLAPHGVRADIYTYLIGHISDGTSMTTLLTASCVFVASWLIAMSISGAMNVATLSDAEASSLGVRIRGLRTICFVIASIMTAAAIALARSIAFVGLICPHICRALFGPDHRQLIITAPFCGAIFLMLADMVVQILKPVFPQYLPVGVITALAGGPFFLILLIRSKNRSELS